MNLPISEIIYLDHHATTPVDPRVEAVMRPFWSMRFGNPSSHQHAYGWDAKNAVEKARKDVAGLISALAREIVFTSSATENINWICFALREMVLRAEPVHIITSTVEHSATREAIERLASWGAKVTWLGVDEFGCIRPDELAAALTNDTRLVSLIYGHNELGTLNDIEAIARVMNNHPAWLHLDCAQALTTTEVNVKNLRVDLLSISSHKMYGPKGIAALYIRSTPKRVVLPPMLVGGSQELALRASTVATPLAVGLGEACRLAALERKQWAETWRIQADEFRTQLRPLGVRFNGLSLRRLPQSMSSTFPASVDRLFPRLQRVAVSTGSACGPHDGPSPVLIAIGLTAEQANRTLRFCLGRQTTSEQLIQVTDTLKNAINDLRS